MANNEHRVLKNNTFEDWRQKSNEVSFDVGDNALLDNTRLGDKVYNYTASAGQVFLSGNDTASKTLVIQKLPDATIDNTGGYIILAHGTTVPGAFVNGATVTQGSDYSATIESVVTVDNKSKILVKNSTGTFSASTNLTVGSASIAHANVERIISESFPKASIRVKKGGTELVQDLSQAGFHIANHKGTITLTGSPSVDKVTEGITIYQASANQTTQAGVEENATWWATVLHSNTTRIKIKNNNNGSLNTGQDIRILGYTPGTAKVDASKVSSISLTDDSVLHTIELNNEASNSDAFVVITTSLVDAVNELQDDIGTVENLATSTQADVVSAINEIEGVFDASARTINTTGNFTVDSSGDIILNADGGDIRFRDASTEVGSIVMDDGSNTLILKSAQSDADIKFNGVDGSSGITALRLDMSDAGSATFNHDIKLPDNGQAIFGAGSDLSIYHDGTNGVIQNSTGDLFVYGGSDHIRIRAVNNEEGIVVVPNADVSLYHNGAKKLETTSGGVLIQGEMESGSLDVNGVANISGAVTLQTSATIGTTLGVTGLSTLGSLTVTGATQLNGGLDMDSGKFSVADGSGNTLIAGTLGVTGATTLTDANLSGSLGVTGASTFGNTVGVTGNFSINTNKFNVTASSGNTLIAGTLGVTGALDVGTLDNLFAPANRNNVKLALNELHSSLGSAVFAGDITNGAASVTAAIGLIETEIGDDEAYNVGGSITYGGNTISAALVSLNNGMKANDSDISTLQNRNINTVDTGSGLSGGGNLTADRNLAIVVDTNVLEIPTSGTNQNKLRVKNLGITNGMLAGSIANSKLSNSAITINSQAISLGGSHTFTTADIGEQTNLYFTNERVDDRVAGLLQEGDAINLVYDDNANTLTVNVKDTIAGSGLAWNTQNASLNITETGNSGITVNANDIAVDSTVLRTNVNGTVASGITLTVAGSLDLSNASVTFPSGGSGSVQNVGTSFLMITAGQDEQGLKIDRSAIDNSHTIDPAIQWDNAKASDIGWEVVYPNPADDAALSASLVTFENAGKLIGQGTSNTELGIAVTWDDSSNTFDFNVNDPILTFTSSTFRSSGNLGQATITNLGDTTFVLTANQLDLGYSEQIKLGGSDELKIYNNNANSIIESSDNIVVQTDHLAINNGANSENMIVAAANGAVSLFYDNSNKLQTKSDGVNVSGELQATSLDINGNADISGDLTLTGDLHIIDGSINKQTVTDLDVTDKTITVGVGQNATASTGSGLLVSGPSTQPSFLWHNTNNSGQWESNKPISASTFYGALSGNATSATTASAVAWSNVTGKPTLDNYVSWTATDGATSPTSYTVTSTDALSFIDSTHIQPRFHADDQLKFHLATNSVGASVLNVSGNGSAGQALISDGDGSMSWSTISGDNTTYDLSIEQRVSGSNDDPFLRLDPSSGDNDDIRLTGGNGITITRMSDTEVKFDGASTYVLPEATSTVRGGAKLFSDTDQSVAANAVSSTAGRTYGIQLNSVGQMVVNVPWQNTQNANQQTTFQVEDGDGTEVTISQGKEWKFVEGAEDVDASGDNYIQINWTDTSTGSDGDPYDLSFSHKRTTRTNSTNGSATLAFGGTFTVIDGVTTNATGHLTGVNTKTLTMPANPDTNTFRTVKVDTSGNGSANNTLTATEDLMLKKGTNITLAEADGVVTISSDNTTYGAATDSTLGLIKTGYTNTGQNYAVDLDGDNEAYVNVPWENTWQANTSSQVGYVASGSGQANKVWKTDANGNPAWRTDANDYPSTASSSTLGLVKIGYTESGKNYPVELSNEQMYVNVPWQNTPQNQDAFSKIRVQNDTVNGTLHEADNTTATFTINAGTNISISDTTGAADSITITNDISNVYDGVTVTNSSGTVKFTHGANGINDDIILKEGSNITLTDGGDDIVVITAANTTYSAGTGLDLSNANVFSIESDLVGEVTKVGSSGSMHIDMSNNGYIDVKNAGSPDTIEFKFESDGDFKADGDIIAFSSSTNSDRKLKENIQKVEGALELVSQLDGVTFNWKKDGKASAGVIAQNVEEVLPSAVKDVDTLNEDDTHKVVDYNQLSALFIEAIKELKEENKLLKAEIESLKDINNR